MEPFIIQQVIDLAGENPVKTYRQPLAAGDSAAHRWEVRVVRAGAAADLTGCTAAVLARREGEDSSPTVRQKATITGNVASAEFIPEVYALGGRILAVMAISGGDGRVITAAVLRLQGKTYTTDTICDPEGTIPSLEALLSRYEDMVSATGESRAATQAAQQATEETRAALSDAQAALATAQQAVTDAQGALGTAQTAAYTANAAAVKIDDMTVSATPLDAGTASSALTLVDGHYHLSLGLPKGDTGATPQISVQVSTGAAGSEASVSVSGTAEDPVIHLTIPRGDTGAIENLTINGKPVESGTITLTPEDLGAATAESVSQLKVDKLDKTGTAADSSKLGGKTWAERLLDIYPIGSIYISVNSTSPASLFGGTWESIGGRFLLGADATYTAGSMGGEATHLLTIAEMPTHRHAAPVTGDGSYISTGYEIVSTTYHGPGITSLAAETAESGGSTPHNNMPPYLAVYMWKRVN
ncbi:MAG: phage baseplate protein [Candidatus Ventricola sp.]